MKKNSKLRDLNQYAMTLIAVLRIMGRRMRRNFRKRIDLEEKSGYDQANMEEKSGYDQDNNEKSKWN